jgi:hypothetical protein
MPICKCSFCNRKNQPVEWFSVNPKTDERYKTCDKGREHNKRCCRGFTHLEMNILCEWCGQNVVTGRRSQRFCSAEHRTLWHSKNLNVRGKAKERVRGTIYRAQRKGIEFSITREYAYALVRSRCYICGGIESSGIVGLDRIDNDEGYTYSNTVACCGHCNTCKNAFTIPQMRKVIETYDKMQAVKPSAAPEKAAR